MASVTVWPVPQVMASVTRSLVSSMAMSGSTGMAQDRTAARTWLRASLAASGSLVSRVRRWRRSAGRMVTIAFTRSFAYSMLVARKILLQLAVQDIGQLTDIERWAKR